MAVALLLPIIHLPNQILFILGGILIFNLCMLPLFLKQQLNSGQTKYAYQLLFFIASFLFNISLLLALQQEFLPKAISLSITVVTGSFISWYFYHEIRARRIHIEKLSIFPIYVVFIALMALNLPVELQAPDYHYHLPAIDPVYPNNDGPVLFFDEAHNNIHTLKDRLFQTKKLLEQDGYKISSCEMKIESKKILNECSVYVVVNPLNDRNIHVWENPTYSAFTDQEIDHISEWVQQGGSLLLIVDHMPVSGAANNLAKEFGFELRNGHAKQIPWVNNWFTRNNSSLTGNSITNGLVAGDRIDSVLAFGGSAFVIPEDAKSILTLGENWFQWEPEIAWDLKPEDRYPAKGYSMGACKTYGKGKVVVYSEAMMFTAQLGGGLSWIKLGMNSKLNPENHRLLLNTIHWLDGSLK